MAWLVTSGDRDSTYPYLYLVDGFLILLLSGFEEGLSIFNHLLQAVFLLLEEKGKRGEADQRRAEKERERRSG